MQYTAMRNANVLHVSPLPPAPRLLTELAEPVLAVAIQLAALSSLWNPAAMAAPLNVLPRASSPLLTQVALMRLPHVDLDDAAKLCDVALLRFMMKWSTQPGGRPVNFTSHGLVAHALKCNNMDVLTWLADESDLCVHWGVVTLAGVVGRGDLTKLDWCRLRGHLLLDNVETVVKATVYASGAGHVYVLDWILEHAGADMFVAAVDSHRDPGEFMAAAAKGGHLDVLDWWTNKTSLLLGDGRWQEQGMMAKIIPSAFEHQHIQVLEWCKSHPEAVRQHHAAWTPAEKSPLQFAVQFDMLDWMDSLGIVPFEAEYDLATASACSLGKVDVLEWLRSKGHLAGSRRGLIGEAAKAASVQVLDWIHQHVGDDSLADVAVRDSSAHQGLLPGPDTDPILVACQLHGIDVLDWLSQHGFTLDQSQLHTYFSHASQLETVDVLDWLSLHLAGSLTHNQIKDIAFRVGFVNARHVRVLDWWFSKVTTVVTSDGVQMCHRFLFPHQAGNCRIRLIGSTTLLKLDVLEWWLRQIKVTGPLHPLIEIGPSVLFLTSSQAVQLYENDRLAYFKYAQAWIDSSYSSRFLVDDWVRYIHWASINGSLDVLDWLFKVIKADPDYFTLALTCDSINPRDADGNPLVNWCILVDNHGKSLLWWLTNFPHIFTSNPSLCLNRDHYDNPIHAHIHKSMLKLAPVPLQDPVLASEYGNVAMLMYLEQERPELLKEQLESSLIEASDSGFWNVLEWWHFHSGLRVTCTKQVADRVRMNQDTKIGRKVAQWWRQSGLFPASNEQEY
ncbi:hypothetical protein BCR44DRAFT_1208903 [Catenaria anguillulae PL171]|uniref:Ankyrin repeat-containing domain protein n=1 Tax=Catenaria anguillulae PL171 TaxID=765915 RepID=A0A1Y2HF69_9FUNG|nr:hypothetical protein BCR44DRAFT_1208903 [Catenaria anguillulae PL171]